MNQEESGTQSPGEGGKGAGPSNLWMKLLVGTMLFSATIAAYGGATRGWFLPKPFDRPVSLRDGSVKQGSTDTHHHTGWYFIGRTHYGGGYAGGK